MCTGRPRPHGASPPRGGFGAKQTAVCEVYPAFVTIKTGRLARITYTSEEAQIAGSPRHEMEITVRLGASKEGKICALDLYTLSNSGAYGEHGLTTVGLSGHKSIPLYTGSLEAYRFSYDVVYTNQQSAGAYRGLWRYAGHLCAGICRERADRTAAHGSDRAARKEYGARGMVIPAYYGEVVSACALDRCMEHCRQMFRWNEKYPVRDMGNGKVRTAGVAMAMQGSCISNVDVGSATVRLAEDGTYNLIIGAADLGTGCDTILAQMVAECMDCELEDVAVFGADTDASPYDSGSYASSTTHITGKAVEKACMDLKKRICFIAVEMLECDVEELVFERDCVRHIGSGKSVSPSPYMGGMVEIELDKLTGLVTILDYMAVVDCAIPINPALARIQTEGGIVQGIGHTLMENITHDHCGKPIESSFMQYKIPTRLDMGNLKVEFENSYESTGPFGAKSIGEIVINTPAPAIAMPSIEPRASGTENCPSRRNRWPCLCWRRKRNGKDESV